MFVVKTDYLCFAATTLNFSVSNVEKVEKADELAWKGASTPLIGTEAFCSLGGAFF